MSTEISRRSRSSTLGLQHGGHCGCLDQSPRRTPQPRWTKASRQQPGSVARRQAPARPPPFGGAFAVVDRTGIEPVASSVSGINAVLDAPPLSTKSVYRRPQMCTHLRARCHVISQVVQLPQTSGRPRTNRSYRHRGRPLCQLRNPALNLASSGWPRPAAGTTRPLKPNLARKGHL